MSDFESTTTMSGLKHCDGGHPCYSPKECCKEGCCYPQDYTVYRPPNMPVGNMFTPIFLGHWYFWAAITATLAGILCACSLWRRHSSSFCCRDSGRDERASEPDSNGSCYAPPQYSRCSSFHQAPPPYSEVTSKPDLYPLVISYNGDTVIKGNGNSTGYLMVQYFRNFIVRPVGSLSATSTIDSLSSSFICNAANEANTVVPPPYSCMGSLEEVNPITNIPGEPQFPRSASSVTCNDYQASQPCSNLHPHISNGSIPSAHGSNIANNNNNNNKSRLSITSQTPDHYPQRQARNNTCYIQHNTTNFINAMQSEVETPSLENSVAEVASRRERSGQYHCDSSPSHTIHRVNRKLNFTVLSKDRSLDSESQEEDHNFSDLLNLSLCVPSSVNHLPLETLHSGTQAVPPDLQQSFSVTNSMTSSDISSLANLGTPDSPPRATSPTVEMRELLDKIQQLPQQKSPVPDTPHHQHVKMKGYFNRTKAKTLYMPLSEASKPPTKISPGGRAGVFTTTSNIFGKSSRSWLSRSAPNTPCGNFVPNFPPQKKTSGSQKGSKVKICDGSPLLNENEESDEDHHKDECL